jgi:hypothetical protein
LVVAIALATSANAAPISGSFVVDLVFAPACFEIATTTDITPDVTGECAKVSDTVIKFEGDLFLRMTISGLEITNTTVFTFEGLEFNALTVGATIGALTVRDTFIFAPSIVELEIVRSSAGSTRYCVNNSAPIDITPPYSACPAASSTLYFMIEPVGVYHPAYMNIALATVMDNLGMLTEPVVFRKKIVDLALNIAGLTISSRALFANLGTSTTPSFDAGIIAAIEGQTVSGVSVRAESWIGTRQGVECFAECKPLEIYRGGKVLSPQNFTIQEEKIFIRNLTIAGVTFNVRIEFQFFTQPGAVYPNAVNPGLSFVEIVSRGNLSFPLFSGALTNTLRLGPDLNPIYDFAIATMKFGDVNVTAVWIFYPNTANGGVGTWDSQLAEFVMTYDPPGVTVTSDLVLCTEALFAGSCSGGVLEHDVYISTTVGNFTFNSKAVFFGLLTGFSELWIDLAFKAGNVDFTFGMVMTTDYLQVARLTTSVKF